MDGGFLSGLGGTAAVVGLVMVVVGLGIAFFGYRLLKVALAIVGFAVGAALGSLLARLLGLSGDVLIIVALVCGLIGAVLSAAVYKFGLFLLGAAAGAVVGGTVGTGLEGNGQLVAVVVGALALGLLVLVAQRIVIIVATALSGSWLAVRAGAALLAGQALAWGDLASNPFSLSLAGAGLIAFLAVWGLLAVAGAWVQFRGKK